MVHKYMILNESRFCKQQINELLATTFLYLFFFGTKTPPNSRAIRKKNAL